jgi:hypothetical protein
MESKRLRKVQDVDKGKKRWPEEAGFKITTNKNDWCFEFLISDKGFKIFRFKVYCKTAYLLTCTGVITDSVRDP